MEFKESTLEGYRNTSKLLEALAVVSSWRFSTKLWPPQL